jgi:hypothetical protein
MPNSGSPGTVGATPQDTTQDSDFIGAIPAGPQKGWSPTDIVQGFLNASISYPVYQDIAKEYLASTPGKQPWAPTWSVKVVDHVSVPPEADYSQGGRIATVDVTGLVQASFDGTGQYVGAQKGGSGSQPGGSGAQLADQKFTLAKVNGEWRITNAPEFSFRMLTQPDFAKVYRAQDLYFFDPTDQVLVPDAVFVPAGTSPNSLVGNLVNALLNPPQPQWLLAPGSQTPPAVTAFPPHTKLYNVTVDGSTATVDLRGAAVSTTPAQRQLMATQLVWTLTGQAPSPPNVQSPPNIQAVQMEINGKPWTPTTAACPATGGPGQSPAQKLFMYRCKNPYPAATSAAFYYAASGQAVTRCAPQSQVMAGNVSLVQPVFDKTGAASLKQACQGSVQASTQATPPPQTHQGPPLTMVAVSPDGKYLAGYSPDGKSLTVWASGQAKPTSTTSLSGVTSIGWDRRDYLWVAQGNATTVVAPATGDSKPAPIENNFSGKILGLGIAPDGVRVAAIVQTGSGTSAGTEVELAAIDSGTPPAGQLSDPFDRMSIGQTVQLGPNVPNPVALTWYDADDLLVIDGAGAQTTLWEVPVDGQPATRLSGVLPGAISITANKAENILVAGLTGNRLEVSAGLTGPWQPLGGLGQNPAFQTPAFPAAAQP